MRKIVNSPRRIAITVATTAITMIAAAAAVMGFVASASAAPRHTGNKPTASCGLVTLRGTYLFHGDGTNVTAGVASALAYAGSITFDGAGNFQGYISTEVGGTVQSDRPYGGTYTVNSNCTGSYTVISTVHVPVSFDLFTSSSGDYFTYVQTAPVGPDFDVDATSAQRVALG